VRAHGAVGQQVSVFAGHQYPARRASTLLQTARPSAYSVQDVRTGAARARTQRELLPKDPSIVCCCLVIRSTIATVQLEDLTARVIKEMTSRNTDKHEHRECPQDQVVRHCQEEIAQD